MSPASGRKATYRSVQILEASSVVFQQTAIGERQYRRLRPRLQDNPNYADARAKGASGTSFSATARMASAELKRRLRLSPRDPGCAPVAVDYAPPPQPPGAAGNSAHRVVQQGGRGRESRVSSRSSTSPPPTPGPATTRRPRKPQPSCRRPIPAAPCKLGRASTERDDQNLFNEQYARLVAEGLRKAGVQPEGEKEDGLKRPEPCPECADIGKAESFALCAGSTRSENRNAMTAICASLPLHRDRR